MLSNHDEMGLDTLGHRIRVDYTPDGEHGREWLRDLLSGLSEDGLVRIEEDDGQTIVQLG